MTFALVSDIHSNMAALSSVMEDIDRRGIKDPITGASPKRHLCFCGLFVVPLSSGLQPQKRPPEGGTTNGGAAEATLPESGTTNGEPTSEVIPVFRERH